MGIANTLRDIAKENTRLNESERFALKQIATQCAKLLAENKRLKQKLNSKMKPPLLNNL